MVSDYSPDSPERKVNTIATVMIVEKDLKQNSIELKGAGESWLFFVIRKVILNGCVIRKHYGLID